MILPELETKILYRKLLKSIKPEIVFDIGSCDCSESKKIAQILPNSTVVAFEANPNNFKEIIKDPDVFKYNIRVHNTAITNNDEEVSFNVIDSGAVRNRGSSSLLNKPSFSSKKIMIRGSRLDSFLNTNYQKSECLALWIDVEGAGYQVLQGIEGIKDKIAFFQIEVEENQIWQGQRTKSEVVELANSLNFREIARGSGNDQYDIVFVHKNYLSKELNYIIRKALLECRFRGFFAYLRDLKRKYLFKSNK